MSTYRWEEWARGDDVSRKGGAEKNKMVGGKLFFAKFGNHPHDPVWAVDILQSQVNDAQIIMSCLRKDAENGFPIIGYPRSLQSARENAALIDLDADILKHEIFEGVRASLGGSGMILDGLRLQGEGPKL